MELERIATQVVQHGRFIILESSDYPLLTGGMVKTDKLSVPRHGLGSTYDVVFNSLIAWLNSVESVTNSQPFNHTP